MRGQLAGGPSLRKWLAHLCSVRRNLMELLAFCPCTLSVPSPIVMQRYSSRSGGIREHAMPSGQPFATYWKGTAIVHLSLLTCPVPPRGLWWPLVFSEGGPGWRRLPLRLSDWLGLLLWSVVICWSCISGNERKAVMWWAFFTRVLTLHSLL